LSPDKKNVLKAFLKYEKAVKPINISKEMGKKFPSVMMHIIGLTKMQYVVSTKKGFYELTSEGKKYLNLTEVNKELAKELLTGKFEGNAFNFYLALHEPINLKADNLQSFVSAIKIAPVESIEFHLRRGDFKVWLKGIGDFDLANKIESLENCNLFGESLKRKLHVTIYNRCLELAKIAGYNVVKK
jgi:hypothetical protein